VRLKHGGILTLELEDILSMKLGDGLKLRLEDILTLELEDILRLKLGGGLELKLEDILKQFSPTVRCSSRKFIRK